MGMDHNLYRTIGMGCLVYSYGDAMISHISNATIMHFEGTDPFIPELVNDYTIEAVRDYDYLIGRTAPNYPLPAIRYEVYIAPNGVSLNNADEWLFYRRFIKFLHI